MSADPVLNAVNLTLQNLGYTTKICTLPNVREWDSTPLVAIVPHQRNTEFIGARDNSAGYSFVTVKHEYAIILINDVNLDTTVDATVNTFKNRCISAFMGRNNYLNAANAWNSTVEDYAEFDRTLVPQGYNYSSILVKVDRIFQGV